MFIFAFAYCIVDELSIFIFRMTECRLKVNVLTVLVSFYSKLLTKIVTPNSFSHLLLMFIYIIHVITLYEKSIMCLKDHIVLFCKIRVDTIYNIMYTRSYYRKESAASPQENKGSMHNLLNKRLFI
jgi:ABC-type bacteriocin/lantibiotic exporter with double-glycine peptidase domain